MGLPARVAATYAFMFVLFGTLLYAKGADFFFDFAAAISGGARRAGQGGRRFPRACTA
jgi:TRAP-type uncharacterized transport system fused permease subunit